VTAFTDPALFRLLLVVSVAIAFAVYTRFHLVGGGSVSGGYVAILAITGQWPTLLGVSFVTLVTLALVRGILLRIVALPRAWVFVLCVLVSAFATIALVNITPFVQAISGFVGISIAFGAFVVPGLLTYDISHQGFPRTMLALGVVSAGTLLICLPAFLLMQGLPAGTEDVAPIVERIPPDLLPFGIIAAIVIGGALRFSFGLRSGGFIGALFIIEFFTITAFVTVILAALATHVLSLVYERYVFMSPRQRSMFALILGSLIAWASLFWASALGWAPAMEANAYTLSPLLAVGLVAADMGRPASGVMRTIIGTMLTALGIAAGLWITQSLGLLAGIAYLLAVTALVTPAAMDIARSYSAAAASGRARTGTISP
jgi:hypothetical protein